MKGLHLICRTLLSCLCLLAPLCAHAVGFATQRIESIVRQLNLNSLDGLKEGTHDNVATYRSHALTVRVNAWGEVEHIGIKVFPSDIRALQPSPAYDFLERYALEWQLAKGTDRLVQLAVQKITFETGSVETLLSLKGDEAFTLEAVTARIYRATWNRGGTTVLSATFDMDWQLMTGCNSIELENRLLLCLKRAKPDAPERTFGSPDAMPTDVNRWSYHAGDFIAKEIRHERYYKRCGDEWQLVCDTTERRQTLYNTLLTTLTPGNPTVEVTLDKYGYKTETVQLGWKSVLSYFISEGCKPYLGIKSIENGEYRCTLFLPNESGGYLHMLSIRMKTSQIGQPAATFAARLYAYVPIHNISKDLFNFQR